MRIAQLERDITKLKEEKAAGSGGSFVGIGSRKTFEESSSKPVTVVEVAKVRAAA